jgi:dolichol-phosphate mannosyltransferase
MPQEEKLSVLIPMFNEERTIGAVLSAVLRVPFALPVELIVIDDGSTDGSAQVVVEYARSDYRVRLIRKTNGGKGSAIRAGLTLATGSIVIVQDADLEYDPAEIPGIIAPILDGSASVVFGSRILERGRSTYTALRYYLGGRVITFLTNVMYGSQLTDEPTCYKAIRTALLRSLDLSCDGFDFCPELTGKLLRRRIPILEVPISYRPRSVADGKKIRFRDAVQAARVLLRERVRRRALARVIEAPARVAVRPEID